MAIYRESCRPMSRRKFLARAGATAALGGVLNVRVLADEANPFTLVPLPYSYDALEPHINRETMQIHHDKICADYVTKLDRIISQHTPNAPYLANMKVEVLLEEGLNLVPQEIRAEVQENAGGVMDHNLFFRGMAPNAGGAPVGKLAQAIKTKFGSYDQWKEKFTAAALKRAGTGWAWLVINDPGSLEITTTENQDTPWSNFMYPVIGLDVCKHAFELQYQNRCADYIAAWYHVVDWKEADRRYAGGQAALDNLP